MHNPKEWGVDVISMSFGKEADKPNSGDQRKIMELIAKLNGLQVTVVAAAGNEGKPLFPANQPTVFSVGALDKDDKPVDWNPSKVDVYAPGVDIAVPLVRQITDGMEMRSGTSCAAPAIAGLIALKIYYTV